MNPRTVYVGALAVLFVLILAAYVGIPGEHVTTTSRQSCSGGWYITGFYTPVEADYNGTLLTVVVNGTARTFYTSFLSDVRVEGWGLTKGGTTLDTTTGPTSSLSLLLTRSTTL